MHDIVVIRNLLIFGIIVGFLALAGVVSAATSISSCTTITSSDTYVLTQNLTSSSTCITIESSDVIFDGQGHSIKGSYTPKTYGIYVYKSGATFTNVTVRNVTVADWTTGIYYNNTVNGSITNNNASNNWYGIVIYNSSNNTLANNTANSNTKDGIHLMDGSNYNNITGNIASNNNNGIWIHDYNYYNTIINNTASSNVQRGIYLTSSGSNNIANNTANSNNRGIYLESSGSNNITGNNADSNDYYGIYLYSSSSNTLTGNNVSNNLYDGIALSSSSNNNITGNNAFENKGGGIWLYSSSNNTIQGNNASGNVLEGISQYSSSSSNIITDNIAMNSYNLSGIYIESSNSSNVTGNTASNNNLGGIYLNASASSNITDNTISGNNLGGIYFHDSNGNTITGNTASDNDLSGIYLNASASNLIYNNFLNNTDNAYDNGNNSWNTTKIPGTNIIGGPNLGGNFWAYPNGTGFSETCVDVDDDGICDSKYNLTTGNMDYIPLKYLPIHNLDTSLSYSTIQNAIDAAETKTGHTVQVDAGTYTENVDVNKSLNIIGAGPGVTIINASATNDHVFNITGINGVNISGFTIKDATGTDKAGIYIENASYNNISRVIVSDNSRDIVFNSSSNSNILSDNILSDYCIGVAIYSSSYNRILDNAILDSNSSCGSGASGSGVYIEGGGGSNNTIAGNTIRWNKYGVYLFNEDLTVVEGNNITDSNYGVYLSNSPNNTISSNFIINNTWGAYLNGSSNNNGNLIYNNYFFNTNNSYDNGTNDWNTTNSTGPNIARGPYIGGNLWSDYIGDDNGSDGFGDTPYNISGGSGADYLPLNDTKSPEITVNSPQNNTAYNTYSIDFNITVSEPINANASVLVYYLDMNTSPLQILQENDLQNPYRWYNDTITLADYGYGEGGYNATFNVTDLTGNSNSSTVYFSVDTTKPNVTLHSPGNNTYPIDSVDLNYTVTDNSGNIYGAGYSLDGAANVTLYGNTTLANLSNGQHILTVYASDTAGNTESSTVFFLVDDSILDMFEWNINTTINNATTKEFTDTYTSKYVDIELSTGNRSVLGYINMTLHNDTPFSINPLNSKNGLGSGESKAGMFVKFMPGSTLDSNSSSLKWVMFRLNYTSTDLSGLVENSLHFYWYNATAGGGNWVKLTEGLNLSSSGGPEVFGTGVNTTDKYVWANLSHFSVYGLAADDSTLSLTEEEKYWHRLGIVDIRPLIGVVIPGTEARFLVIINNLGDFAERGVRIGFTDLPKGWIVEDTVTDVGYREKVRVIFPVHIPADVREGKMTLTFKVIPGDFIANIGSLERQVSIMVDKAPPLAIDIPVISVTQNITAPTAAQTVAPHDTEVTKGVEPVTPPELLEPPVPEEEEGYRYGKITVFGFIGLLLLIIMTHLKKKSS